MRCVTLSDFNISNFDALLAHDETAPAVEVVRTGFGQLHPCLLDPNASCWRQEPDAALVWTRPEAAVPAFRRRRSFEPVTTEELLEGVDAFVRQLMLLAGRVGTVLVPTWTLPPEERGLGLLDLRPDLGIADGLLRMNLRLAESLADQPGFYVLDAGRWVHAGGRMACNPKLWARAKIPFSNQVFQAAVVDVKAALRAVRGEAKKLVIVDLDNTLWGGVVGDDGWEGLQLGGHDPAGEAFVTFQHALKALTNRGILLGIVSKNTETVALEAITKHPEMVLRLEDFAGWQINWEDKARNVAALTEELNLGLQSVVFIDDNPFERARVREALPEVLVPEWPEDPLLYARTLQTLDVFDTATLTGEDRRRAEMYRAEQRRRTLKQSVQSLEDWLATLEMVVQVEPFNEANRARVVQLLNKTNQMNLRTRRLTDAELEAWVAEEGHVLRAFRVSDRFGEAGLTGILSLERRGDDVHLADFVLSCRVMGRQVEETMVAVAVQLARELGGARLVAEYLPTPKNKPCLEFWRRAGWVAEPTEPAEGEPVRFTWMLNEGYPVPSHISLILE